MCWRGGGGGGRRGGDCVGPLVRKKTLAFTLSEMKP